MLREEYANSTALPIQRESQQGLILITISIILIMVGYTTFSALSRSKVELNISASNKKAVKVFNYSEYLISEAEKTLEKLGTDDDTSESGSSNAGAGSGIDETVTAYLDSIRGKESKANQARNDKLDAKVDWRKKENKKNAKTSNKIKDAGEGIYLIQYLGQRVSKDEGLNMVSLNDDLRFKKDFYLVTARFADASIGITREVQTVYSTASH